MRIKTAEAKQKEGYESSGPMRHQHIAIRNGSRVSPPAKLTAQELAELRRARRLGLLGRQRLSCPGRQPNPEKKMFIGNHQSDYST
jgi:hypothetical protein